MNRKTIVWTTEDGHRLLAYKDSYTTGSPAPHAPYEDLAQLCDLDAEGANHHSFVGVHRLLAALLFLHVGRLHATDIMREVAECGGLHRIRRCDDA